MPSTYSSSLRFELIGNGEQAGNWGNTTNTNIGTLIEQAIAGVANITMAGSTTLTLGNGVSDEARNAVLILGGTLSGAANLIVPAVDKLYVVRNATSGGQVVTVKTSAGTGVALDNGYTQVMYCDGTNVVAASQSFNPAIAPGTVSSITLATTGTGLTVNGGSSASISTSGTFTLAGTLDVDNGGTGLSALPTNGRFLVSNGTSYGSSTITSGNAITASFNGTNFVIDNAGVTSLSPGSGITLSGSTGNILISATGGAGGGVTTFSAGSTGFSPAVATSGAVTLSGTLATSAGGTGLGGFGASNNALYSNSSSTLVAGTLPIAAGGTGATTASSALSALGAAGLTSNSFSGTQSAPTFSGTTFSGGSFSGTTVSGTTFSGNTYNLNSNSARFWTDNAYTNVNFNSNSSISYNGSSQYDVFIQGTVRLSIQNGGCFAPAFTPTSDRSLKENIQPVSGGLNRVLAYQPVTFNWKPSYIEDPKTHEGFIAQDVEVVNPLAVVYSGEVACLDPVAIIADLVASVQELSAQVEALKAQIQKA
jgi:hypothetical protein